MEYKIKWYEDHSSVNIENTQDDYSMKIFMSESFPRVDFLVRNINYGREGAMLVTDRDLKNYDPDIKGFKINPDLLYLEVGPGLGEFIPRLVKEYKLKQKIIAIEPSDFNIMRKMLTYAKSLPLKEKIKDRLDILIERCDIILDPSKVILINRTLNEAAESNTHIIGTADVLVDNFSATYYSKYREWMIDLEYKFLKPDGVRLSNI